MKPDTGDISYIVGKYRWTICSLVFFATTINYLDRQVISLVKPYLDKEFGWTKSDYANMISVFQLAYAFTMVFAGKFIDRIGTKLGYALSLLFWSIAAIFHGLIRTTTGFFTARAALGITESGNFPAAIKTIAEWFPKKERALATGIFNSGTNIGAIVAPLTVPFIALKWGWRSAFVITGAIGLLWLIFWFIFYEVPAKQKRLKQKEFEFIHSDPDELLEHDKKEDKGRKISWVKIFAMRQTWVFALGKFLTDGIWWFYLFWLPDFLNEQYHLKSTEVAIPVALVYVIASVGSILGGWPPLYLINKGWPVFKARKTAMLFYALCVLPVVSAQWLGAINMWFAIIIIGIAAAAHQAWSANIFTTVSDMFPKRAVASVTGIGGMAGGLGSIFIAKSAGYLFDFYKANGHIQTGYAIMFVVCSVSYIVAWILMQMLTPKKMLVPLIAIDREHENVPV